MKGTSYKINDPNWLNYLDNPLKCNIDIYHLHYNSTSFTCQLRHLCCKFDHRSSHFGKNVRNVGSILCLTQIYIQALHIALSVEIPCPLLYDINDNKVMEGNSRLA